MLDVSTGATPMTVPFVVDTTDTVIVAAEPMFPRSATSTTMSDVLTDIRATEERERRKLAGTSRGVHDIAR